MLKNEKRTILCLLGVGLALRLVWSLMQPTTPSSIARLPDQAEYLSLGQNLLAHGSLNFVDPRFGQTIWAYRMPGYPAAIAASGGSVIVLRIAQSLIDTSTIFAVYLLSQTLIKSGSLIAAGLIAINPFYIYFSGLILSETAFTALMSWALLMLVRQRFASAMVLLTIACYFRPAAILFGPMLVGLALLNPVSQRTHQWLPAIGKMLLGAIATALCIAVALLPWLWRNHARLGSLVWTTTNSGITMYDGFNPSATGASDQRFVVGNIALQSMNELQRTQYFEQLAWQWIGDHRMQLPLLSLRKILRTWSPLPLSTEFGRTVYRIASGVYEVPFDLLCVLGLFSYRLSFRAKLLLIAPALLITLGTMMSVGSIRYRMPAEAPLAVLAAAGFLKIFSPGGVERSHPGLAE